MSKKKKKTKKLFRSMFTDPSSERPVISNDAKSLGVRIPINETYDPTHHDVEIDNEGNISPDDGGMSVVSKPHYLPHYKIPRRLKGKFKNATGKDDYSIWCIFEDEVTDKRLIPNLKIVWDNFKHALIKPCSLIQVDKYCEAIASTQEHWNRYI